MKNALASLGCSLSDKEMSTWEYHVSLNSKLRRVEMWVTFTSGVQIKEHNIHIRPRESVLVEFSRKFSIEDVHELAARSNFYIQRAWRSELYGCQVLYSAVQALRSCWDDTDALLNGVADWKSKPIELRHPFLFYYGHVNAFTKLKLLNTMETMEMDVIFSRGINPYVLDPSKCHRHPEPPQEWPSKEAICAYVQEVRSMVAEAVKMGGISMRLVHFVVEHERMHQETLQYMLAQETRRDFERTYSSRSPQSNEQRNGQEKHVGSMNGNGVPGKRNTPNVCVLPGEITMGADKCDSVFLWDNEMPSVETFVTKAFLVSAQPVSISEYMEFVKAGGYGMKHLWEEVDFPYFKEFKWPATWSYANGDYYVHEPGITKHWEEVANQPVYVSLAEAQAYSKWAGDFRVMTEEEYHRALLEDGKTVFGLRDGGWEWTSTAFRGFPGFEAMAEYEEYSVDFFDGQHFVLKGSSPWTHPALIRDSFRNFYQRQYPYVFAKFRCCKSVANEAAPRAESNGSNPHYRYSCVCACV
ncbi:hypothetical protein KP509_17G012500 [Ceratopteris richardii]|nr:hypothetical protein KP509_17G012500 [Ceratopteris richardii]